MDNLLNFKTLITPRLIQIIFWVGTASMVIPSLMILPHSLLSGVVGILAAPVFMRVSCEVLLVLFRIDETLQAIKDQKQSEE